MRRARCNAHQTADVFPQGCQTCVRIRLEANIVKRTVRTLLANGYTLRVNDGESLRPNEPTESVTDILSELMEVDIEHLEAHKDGRISWVLFVYGNDGYDVISDYTVNLETVLQVVNDYARRMEG